MVVNVDEWVRSFGLELAFAGCAEAATIVAPRKVDTEW